MLSFHLIEPYLDGRPQEQHPFRAGWKRLPIQSLDLSRHLSSDRVVSGAFWSALAQHGVSSQYVVRNLNHVDQQGCFIGQYQNGEHVRKKTFLDMISVMPPAPLGFEIR